MINPYDVVVDVIHVADMDEAYGTYAADDESLDNHDYDDTDDDKAWRRRDLLIDSMWRLRRPRPRPKFLPSGVAARSAP